MIRIPGKKWVQTNRSNLLGNLWSTFNIDLQSNLGAVRVSPRMKLNTSTDDVATLSSNPIAIRYAFSKFWVMASARIFEGGDTPDNTFAADDATDAQTDYNRYGDLELFNGLLFSTTDDDVWSSSGTAWTQRGGATSLTSSKPHLMTYFKKFNRLYVMKDNDVILSFNTSYTLATSGDYTLDFATSQQYGMLCMKATSDSIWIGVGGQLSPRDPGKIYQWDGISAQPTAEYVLQGNACLAICIMNEVPYALDSLGILYQFNGIGFQEVGRLPMARFEDANIYSLRGPVHPNGFISTRNGTILALVDNENVTTGATIEENLPSGIWEWSRENGFVHKHSLSYNPVANATITDYGQNRISRPGALYEAQIDNTDSGNNGTLMCGATFYSDATNTKSGIFIDDSNDTVQKFGYFVTTWIRASGQRDIWEKVSAFYRKLLASTDRITVKYRLTEASPTEISATWVNTTSFTTSTDISGMIGYEVEGIVGTGSGFCAHLSAVSESGGTYTGTVDEAFTGVTTGTTKLRLQAWKKLFQVSDQNSESVIRSLLNKSSRIQLKCTMLFTGEDELYELGIVNRVGDPTN